MEDTWLNPDFATDQIVTLVTILLASLILLPALFAALIYGLLSLVARLTHKERAVSDDSEFDDEG